MIRLSKNTLSLLALGALLGSQLAFGASPMYPLRTVAAIQQAADDTRVQLQGQLVEQIIHEHYRFRDASGEMVVEIDDEDLPQPPLNRLLKLNGEVDVERDGQRTLDVEYLQLLP